MFEAASFHPGIQTSIPPKRYLPFLTTEEVRDLDKDRAVVVLPVASIEQHGPHLPICTDWINLDRVLGRALEQLEDQHQIWVLPALPYGKSNEHFPIPGTYSLSARLLMETIMELGQCVARDGFKKLMLLGAHGGNYALLEVVARDVHVATGMMVFFPHLRHLWPNWQDYISEHEQHLGMHAGAGETMFVLGHTPQLVQMDRRVGEIPVISPGIKLTRMPEGLPLAWTVPDLSESGVIGDPSTADPEAGQRMFEAAALKLVDQLAAACTCEPPGGMLISRGSEPLAEPVRTVGRM